MGIIATLKKVWEEWDLLHPSYSYGGGKSKVLNCDLKRGDTVPVAPFIQPIVLVGLDGKCQPTAVSVTGLPNLPVTEASAANSLLYITQSFVNAIQVAPPSISGATLGSDTTLCVNRTHRIGRAVIQMDGGGDHAYVELVPALAGYYGAVKITSVKTSVAAAAGILTFQSPAATAALPNVENQPALGANIRDINMQGLVITHATLLDAQAIGVVYTDMGISAWVEIMYEYWYET